MGMTKTLAKRVMDHLFGAAALVNAANYYLGLHLCSTLSAQAAAGQNQIQLAVAIPVGSSITIDPLGGAPGTFTVLGRAGAGPYTHTLSGNLTQLRALGTVVSYEPGKDSSGVVEPAGNGYARTLVANNLANWPATVAPNEDVKSNGTAIVFPASSGVWGLASHYLVFDALAGGNLLYFSAITNGVGAATPVQVGSGQVPRFEAGTLILTGV